MMKLSFGEDDIDVKEVEALFGTGTDSTVQTEKARTPSTTGTRDVATKKKGSNRTNNKKKNKKKKKH